MLDELIATDGVREVAVTRSRVAVMALHGGLEHATFPLAESIAERSGSSLYAVVQPENFWWHVPSTRYDPAMSDALAGIVTHADLAISLHGFGRPGYEDTVLLGGSHRSLAATIGRALRDEGIRAIDEVDEIPKGLRGLHPANPVNLPAHGGVQIELSDGVRRRPVSETLVRVLVAAIDGLDSAVDRETSTGSG